MEFHSLGKTSISSGLVYKTKSRFKQNLGTRQSIKVCIFKEKQLFLNILREASSERHTFYLEKCPAAAQTFLKIVEKLLQEE